MPAATLQAAAGLAYTNVARRWNGGQLKVGLTAFYQAIDPSFLEDQLNDHPIGNWIVLIAGLSNECPADTGPPTTGTQFSFMDLAGKYVYRICWLASYLVSQNLITAAQGTVILNAFNAQWP